MLGIIFIRCGYYRQSVHFSYIISTVTIIRTIVVTFRRINYRNNFIRLLNFPPGIYNSSSPPEMAILFDLESKRDFMRFFYDLVSSFSFVCQPRSPVQLSTSVLLSNSEAWEGVEQSRIRIPFEDTRGK